MKFKGIVILLIALVSNSIYSQEKDLIDIMQEELNREMAVFSDFKDSVYFLSYNVSDDKTTSIIANGGSITYSNISRMRTGRVDLRMGDYARDNTRTGNSFYAGAYNQPMILPNENIDEAIKYVLWKSTRSKFFQAKQQFAKINTEKQDKQTKDFSKEKPQVSKPEVAHEKDMNIEKWSAILKEVSLLFVTNEYILSSDVSLTFSDQLKYFVSSEGTVIREKQTHANIYISASVATEDDLIPYFKTFFAFTPDGLPSREELLQEAKNIIATLEKLRKAPKAEPYSGPAILSSEAAGVFFHEIFGHRIEGHRLRSDLDGQTFKDKIDQKILSEAISVYSDPTEKVYGDFQLSGTYAYDDQGVRAERVEIVKDGYLKTFLMSRSPLETIEKSNGHARASNNLTPVARQSNLIIESSKGLDDQALRQLLIEECKKTGKPYGYYFEEVTGGFTQTDRYSPNAFNIDPMIVYKVYADGRPDELVRGVNLIGTPLLMFGQIKATGNEKATFNGFCGAESGYIPVSATSPALFVEKIETQKKAIVKPPKPAILKDPVLEGLKGQKR